MNMAERAYLVMMLDHLRPTHAVEVGSGPSTLVIAEMAKRVTVVDPYPSDLIPRGVKVVKRPSQRALRRIVRPGVDFVLIDGDHSPEAVRIDVDSCLSRPSKNRMLVMHDTGNDDCRAGIEASGLRDCEWVHHVDLDIAPPRDGWGGLGIAKMHHDPRPQG